MSRELTFEDKFEVMRDYEKSYPLMVGYTLRFRVPAKFILYEPYTLEFYGGMLLPRFPQPETIPFVVTPELLEQYREVRYDV